MIDIYQSERTYLFDRVVPAFAALLAGKFVSDTTSAFFLLHDNVLMSALMSLFWSLLFVPATLAFATPIWIGTRIVVGKIGRREFQAIWIWTAFVVQIVGTAALTYLLWTSVGIGSSLPKVPILLAAAPYMAYFFALRYLVTGRKRMAESERAQKQLEVASNLKMAPARRSSRRVATLFFVVTWLAIAIPFALTDRSNDISDAVLVMFAACFIALLVGGLLGGIAYSVRARSL